MSPRTALDRPRAGALALRGGTPVSASPISMVSIRMGEAEIEAAVGVMRSGMLAAGEKCLELESRFAAMSDARYAMACANGTCALQLAYGPLIEPGDEVLVPAWTYIATATMVVAAGGVPVFCDADPETYDIDVKDAASKVSDRTTAIACTHLYGNPVDIDAVEALAADRSLSVIYDAAQAHLSTYKGRGVGAYGDAVTYSFYPTKNMTTGEGGLVTTNDDNLAAQIRALRSHGETEKYVHASIGFNYRMSDIEAAVGLVQLDHLEERTQRRRQNAASLDRAIAGISGLHAARMTDKAEGAFHLYPVRLDEEAFSPAPDGGLVRDLFCEALRAEGIGTAVHYPRSLTRQPVFDRPGVEHQPVSDRLARTLFCVPVHHDLDDRQLSLIGESLDKVAAALHA